MRRRRWRRTETQKIKYWWRGHLLKFEHLSALASFPINVMILISYMKNLNLYFFYSSYSFFWAKYHQRMSIITHRICAPIRTVSCLEICPYLAHRKQSQCQTFLLICVQFNKSKLNPQLITYHLYLHLINIQQLMPCTLMTKTIW